MSSTPTTRARRTPAASSASGPPAKRSPSSTYFGLYALQHRGQESAGIATSDGSSILVFKDMGLVSQVFDEATLGTLRGHLAVGHMPLLHHRRLHLGERPADARRHRRRHGRPGAQRQPDQLRRAARAVRERYGDRALRDLGTSHHRHRRW